MVEALHVDRSMDPESELPETHLLRSRDALHRFGSKLSRYMGISIRSRYTCRRCCSKCCRWTSSIHHRHQTALVRFPPPPNSLPHDPERNPTTITTHYMYPSCHHHHSNGEQSLNSQRSFPHYTSSSVLPASADLSHLAKSKMTSSLNRTFGQNRLYIQIWTWSVLSTAMMCISTRRSRW